MKCLFCDEFSSWNETLMMRHICAVHYIWEEVNEWDKTNDGRWFKKTYKKIKFIDKGIK